MEPVDAVWDEIYRTGKSGTKPLLREPSSFALSVTKLLKSGHKLLEFGCGNGRDAAYFHEVLHLEVNGTDISHTAIEQCRKACPGAEFAVQSFAELPTPYRNTLYDVIYSRFTLHSVSEAKASQALRWAYNNLHAGGMLLIEVRSTLDTMCGIGEPVEGERNAWINHHYRRFVVREELLKELQTLGFEITFEQEDRNLSPHGDDNPVLIRVHARRN